MSWWYVGTAALVLDLAWRLRLTRAVLRELRLVLTWTELGAARLVRWVVRPQYVLVGECHKTGLCCRQILSDPPKLIKSTRAVHWFAAYHRVMHNFTVVARGTNDELIFSCGHLRTDNRCGIYRHRPVFCRTYPAIPYYGAPSLLPGCTFRVAHRQVAAITPRASLRILNPRVAVHHPSPSEGGDLPEHYHLVDAGSGD